MKLYYMICRFWDAVRFWCRDTVFYLGHGFHLVEIWNMDTAAARWFIPRLRYFKAHHAGTPFGMTDAEWTAIIGKILRAFEMVGSWTDGDSQENADATEAGLDLFRKHFRNLWD